ncbi:LAMI_0D06590g1_1 [Lachancea mirantina]|uniref:LAMI_0D06590g1_1 n=1 Tax=Lachancea mirantina TaxID=1230905 RepID=A0A1G4JC49_9SACH|nr:LAMI_0D06590g1_1 [Lachancea mirantina]
MSSVHSQESEGTTEPGGLDTAQKVSRPGTANATGGSGDNSSGSNRPTIRFEKQRVVPRARTQSVQSVLSSISLRSMMNKHQEELSEQQQQQQQQQGGGGGGAGNHGAPPSTAGTSGVGVPFAQQIQSPAMVSARKRTTSVNTVNTMEEIGQKMPFTDDKRQALDADGLSRNRNGTANGSENQRPSLRSSASSSRHGLDQQSGDPIYEDNEDDADDDADDAAKQKKLTADALRRLSAIRQNQKLGVTAPGPNPDDSLLGESLTHLQFGGKNVILDSSIPSRRKSSVMVAKQSSNLLPSTIESASRPRSSRPVRQINTPKKPLYTPAVLRDISKTNITNSELRRSPAAAALMAQDSLANTSSSSVRSMRSTSSSILSECTKRFFGRSGSSALTVKAELVRPSREHWISDSKRHACHYCHKIFTFWERKHHCRHCGDIFCMQHVRHWLYLDQQAHFVMGGSGIGALSKVCDTCLHEYETLIREGSAPESAQQAGDTLISPHANGLAGTNPKLEPNGIVDDKDKRRGRMDSIVGSIPADWNWSSF